VQVVHGWEVSGELGRRLGDRIRISSGSAICFLCSSPIRVNGGTLWVRIYSGNFLCSSPNQVNGDTLNVNLFCSFRWLG
jgi:hypothetical protein